MTLNNNKFSFNWSTPDATTGKIIKLEKEVVRLDEETTSKFNTLKNDVVRLEDEINQQGLAFKREEGTDVFIITKETIHSVDSTELKLYPIPDLSHVPPTGQIFAYTLPRSYVNSKNQVIGTVYTTLNENNTFNNPEITKIEPLSPNSKYAVTYFTSDKPGIVISDFNPFDMYTLGELRIEWIPKPTTLTSPAKVVCDIIDAKNALQLYETPIPVFFRPVNYGEDTDYWWMTWGYKNDSTEFSKLLEGQPFRFTESSFGHNYTLYKNGGSWAGNNMCTAFPSKTSYHSWSKGSVFSLFVSNSEGMKTQLRALGIDPGSNTAYALRTYAKIYKSNGTLANVSNDWYTNTSQTISGYDKAMCVVDDKSVSNGETITCKIDINGNISLLTSQAHTSQSGLVWFTPLVNCLDSISYYSVSTVAPQKATPEPKVHELKLYMKKGEVFKFTDNNWDGSTNPFVYLNNVDGYNITPDPSSAATLTTPYSIVSNGVMLAENLESHTYKINDIGNDITAINNQISNINNQIFTLQHFQAYIEEKNSWYNVLEENMVSILGSCMLKFALPIDLYSLRSPAARAAPQTPWQMSYQGIDSLPQLTFSANTTQPIKAITYSTDTTTNDDESLPTTKWVNDKISSISITTDSPTFTGTTTVTNLNATGSITADTFNGYNLGMNNSFYKLPAIPIIRDDLVMEVGRYIDFHYNASTDVDKTSRISISNLGTLHYDHSLIVDGGDIKARNCISDNGNLHDAINKIADLESSISASYIVGMTLKLKEGVNPPSTGTWKRVGLWGVYDTILTKSNGAKFHIYTTYNGAYATVNIRLSDQPYQESIPLTELGVASTDSYWFINSGVISSGTYPAATIQIPVNANANAEFRFNGGNIEPQGAIHEFSNDSIFSFSVKLSDFSNSSYKHQYVEWEKTA